MPVADRNAVSWTAAIGVLMRAGRSDVGYGKDEAHAKHLGMCQCARHIAWFADGQTAKLVGQLLSTTYPVQFDLVASNVFANIGRKLLSAHS
ncbi:hypothetical protein [Oryza sativa Japonica Group]|uniref:Uncharacterized protein n=1 Tax=Oryza sativa subsp. japonica TaxID=39947 RepID=Q5NA86_ORYSJ|nr:hypothetical protein [Oryza sativa Japonica Group]BAD81635.1 hypothetical protein [Oryza sativa Japonica Group]